MGVDDVAIKSVASVERGLMLLQAFSRDKPRLSLTELADSTGLYKSTVLRLAQSLEQFGLLSRSATGEYTIGPASLQLAATYLECIDPLDVIRPGLRELVKVTGESATFYVRNGQSRVCVSRVESPKRVRDNVQLGDIIPLQKGAAGQVILAFSGATGTKFAHIREAGFATSIGEVTPDTAALAAPVFQAQDKLVGAIAVSGPRMRMDGAAMLKSQADLLKIAADMSRQLGYTHASQPKAKKRV